MKKYYITSVLMVASLLVGLAVPVSVAYAEEGSSGEEQPTTVKTTEVSSEEKARKQAEEKARKAKLEEAARAAKEEAKAKAEAAKAAAKTRLEGERSKRCEEREAKINQVVANSSSRAKDHLARFQAFQQRVEDFVSTKNVTVANYEGLLADANAKQAAAVAAVEATAATTFKCADQDATNVGGVVSSAVSGHLQALKDYRASLKALAKAVKEAYQATTEDNQAN